MKKLLIPLLILIISASLPAQVNKANVLQDLEKDNKDQQVQSQTATIKSATRLFGGKDDLTSVILVIPSGSTVSIIDSDSTYFKVSYNDSEGYIFRKDAVIDNKPGRDLKASSEQMYNRTDQQVKQYLPNNQQNAQTSRLTYLENKYGTKTAALLNAGKIWRGMTSEMVRDSWGPPSKISKTFEGTIVKEEWIFKNTWLYIENDILSDWGPVKNQ